MLINTDNGDNDAIIVCVFIIVTVVALTMYQSFFQSELDKKYYPFLLVVSLACYLHVFKKKQFIYMQ